MCKRPTQAINISNCIGLQSDLIVLYPKAQITDRTDRIVVASPRRQDFHGGNFLFLKSPPSAASLPYWEAEFDAAFAAWPKVAHRRFVWRSSSSGRPAHTDFVTAGYSVEHHEVLTAREVRGVDFIADYQYRTCSTDDDWSAVFELEAHMGFPGLDAEEYESFLRDQIDTYRGLVQAQRGRWFTIYRGDVLVSSLGIFWRDGLARYQMVTTAASHRRQGLASSLVSLAGRTAMENGDAQLLIIVAKTNSTAERIYRRLGFSATESIVEATKTRCG